MRSRLLTAALAVTITPLDLAARVWRALGDVADAVDRHYTGRLGGEDDA